MFMEEHQLKEFSIVRNWISSMVESRTALDYRKAVLEIFGRL